MVKEFLFDDRASLFTALADACRAHLGAALADTGKAALLVSGGSTPAPLYETLGQSDLDWANIHVALVDERWVDKEHSASNEALICRTLLNNKAANAPFTAMKTADASAAAGCAETEAKYRSLPRPFSVTILGMGSDGHTASLFPHAQGLAEALAADSAQLTAPIIAEQSAVTGPNTERLSLTLHGLLQSSRLIILLTGEDKLAVFRAAQGEGAVEDMPVRAILRQHTVPVELYWAP
ncbi:MAG: 6-phosphogluconolactonase [Gammaproteobacteria bacterium]